MQIQRRSFLWGATALIAARNGAARAEPVLAAGHDGQTRMLGSGAQAGEFAWAAGDLSQDVAADPMGAVFIPPTGDQSGRSGAWVRSAASPLRPEWFGAKGDGITNDTAAMTALSIYVNSRGGGEIAFRPVTYIVGAQSGAGRRGAGFAFRPATLLEFLRCSRPVIVRGNHARIRCASGLRYGTFDPVTGEPTQHPMPFNDGDEVAAPYAYMIRFNQCSGPIELHDIELDGNLAGLQIGGTFGDRGRQITCMGVGLFNCTGPELIQNVYTHHHALDGVKLQGVNAFDGSPPPRLLSHVRSEYNARQGCSIDSGWRYAFEDCQFNHTGKAGLASSPGGGVDLESHARKQIREFSFSRCSFVNNTGPGIVADKGDESNVVFTECTFVGTTDWAVWPKKPAMTFRSCNFVGAIVNCFGSPDPALATSFVGCTFRDDPRLSPTGKVYLGKNPSHPIADLDGSQNVLFKGCTFALAHDAVLPWSTHAIYEDCTMRQTATAFAYPRGTYRGRNSITGKVHLEYSSVAGTLAINGKPVAPHGG